MNGVAKANLYAMVEKISIFGGDFCQRDERGSEILKYDRPLKPGNYYLSEHDIRSVGLSRR